MEHRPYPRIAARYPSRVAARLGLPAIAGNVAEGYVLKPDARARPDERYVVERKMPEFDDARFDEATPWHADAALDLGALRDEVTLDVPVDLEAAFPAALRALTPRDDEALRAHVAELAAQALIAG